MSSDITGKKVLVIVTNYGAETDELLRPVKELAAAGAKVTVAAPSLDPVQTLVLDKDAGPALTPTITFDQVDTDGYDVLVIPGGTINADAIRGEALAQNVAKAFAAKGKPVAAICHAPWLLIESDLVKGKELTSWKSLKTDIENAGGHWTDKELVVDANNGWTLITSRSPFDLDAFIGGIEDALV